MAEGEPKKENNVGMVSKIEIVAEFPPDNIEDPLWVDFDFGENSEMGVKSSGQQTYVISPVSEQNLFSDKYINCTGTVGFGRDKTTGKEIAFISHQDPEYFLNKGDEETQIFTTDLEATLRDLLSRSVDGTVEVILFGGNDEKDAPKSKKSIDYEKSIKMLSKVVEGCIGRVPVVVRDANHMPGAVDATIITQERKIFIA